MASGLIAVLQNSDLLSIKTLWLVLYTVIGAVLLHFVIKCTKIVLKMRRQAEELKEFKGPKPHWLYGNLGQFRSAREGGDPLKQRMLMTEKYGPVFLFWLGPFAPLLMFNDPENIQAIFNTAEPKDYFGYRFLLPWIGDGLLISSGRKWARNRRLLTPSFHFDILRPYVDVFRESTEVMINKWKSMIMNDKKDTVEMFEHVSLMTLDSLMKCIFGVDGNFQQTRTRNPYIDAVYAISEMVIKRFRTLIFQSDFIFNLTKYGRKYWNSIKQAHKFTRTVVAERRKAKDSEGEHKSDRKYRDFLDMLLDCRDDEGNGLTDQEIYDEVDTFMFEGHDTTASGISWIFYNLAKHPEIQEKCRQEINSILDKDEDLTWDKLGEMKYLTMCIKESLRISSPVPATGREVTKPLTLPDGRVVPKGASISIGISAAHRDPKHWPDPLKYDPERFSPDNSKDRHSHAFMPFAAGPRNCIGQNFAMNEMKTCVSLVLRHFRLTPDTTRPPIRMAELITRSVNGMWIKLEEI